MLALFVQEIGQYPKENVVTTKQIYSGPGIQSSLDYVSIEIHQIWFKDALRIV